MTAPQASSGASSDASADAVAELPVPPQVDWERLNRPWRAVVALVELALAGVAIWAAFWAWPHGFATITTPGPDGLELVSHRTYGNWLAAAVGFGVLAGLLVVDALRQTVLAVRARPRRVRREAARAD